MAVHTTTPSATPEKPVLPARLQAELAEARARHMEAGIGRTMKTRLPLGLVEAAKKSSGITSDDELLHAALVHLVMDGNRDA